MENYNLSRDEETITVKETANNRLNSHAKLVKCSICDTTDALRPFKSNYVCEECITYFKDALK